MTIQPKQCETCGMTFLPTYRVAKAYWAGRRFCSPACTHAGQRGVRLATFGVAKVSLAEKFWSKVDRRGADECWPWAGAANRAGYGKVGKRGGDIKAHRLSYELNIGPIPKGLCVCHRCDNPPCVNPAHLFLGTIADNNADRVAKGRGYDSRGEANANVRLSKQDVEEVIRLRAAGMSQQAIADRFDISQAHVSRITRGRAWQSLGEV